MTYGTATLDAQAIFEHELRRHELSRVANGARSGRLELLIYDTIAPALAGSVHRDIGTQSITLDSIVGTVDRGRDFDGDLRPTSTRVRTRWERIAAARRRGEAMPAIEVYRVLGVHFIREGHHRVSVARALGDVDIEARVTEAFTHATDRI